MSVLILILLVLTIWWIEFLVFRLMAGKSFLLIQLVRLLTGVSLLCLGYYFDFINSDFLKFGNTSVVANPVYWLGIGDGETWKTVSIGFLFSISLVTFLSLYIPNNKHFKNPKWSYLWIFSVLLMAFNNAAIEEILYRLVPLSFGGLPPTALAVCSGVAFGLPHYFGYPSKWPGVILASFLGWFLAKSVLETQGIFLAILFHWVQDILIIGLLSISQKPSIYSGLAEDKKVFFTGVVPITLILLMLSIFIFLLK